MNFHYPWTHGHLLELKKDFFFPVYRKFNLKGCSYLLTWGPQFPFLRTSCAHTIPALNFNLAVTYFFWESSACPLSDCHSMLPKSPHKDVISDLKIKEDQWLQRFTRHRTSGWKICTGREEWELPLSVNYLTINRSHKTDTFARLICFRALRFVNV